MDELMDGGWMDELMDGGWMDDLMDGWMLHVHGYNVYVQMS